MKNLLFIFCTVSILAACQADLKNQTASTDGKAKLEYYIEQKEKHGLDTKSDRQQLNNAEALAVVAEHSYEHIDSMVNLMAMIDQNHRTEQERLQRAAKGENIEAFNNALMKANSDDKMRKLAEEYPNLSKEYGIDTIVSSWR